MKFTVNIQSIKPYLALCSLLATKKHSLPILQDIKFEIDDTGLLTLTATDLVTTVTCNIQVELHSGEGFDFLLPGKIVTKLLELTPISPTTFTYDLETEIVIIETVAGHYRFVTNQQGDYPMFDSPDTFFAAIPAQIIKTGFEYTEKFAADDPLRAALSAVNVKLDYDNVQFESTDGHILSVLKYNIPEDKTLTTEYFGTNFLVNRDAIKIIQKAFEYAFENIDILTSESAILFSTPQVQVQVLTVDGKYPDVNAVLPRVFKHQIQISADLLANSVKRIALFDENPPLNFNVTKKELSLIAERDEMSAFEEIKSHFYEGSKFTFALKTKFLQTILDHFKGEEIYILANNERTGIVINPVGQAEEYEVTTLIMPVIQEL